MGSCFQVNIPTVDNSELECDEFISSKCVYIKDTKLVVDGKPYPTLNDYIEFLEAENSKLKRANGLVREELSLIKNHFRDIKAEFKTLQRMVKNLNV